MRQESIYIGARAEIEEMCIRDSVPSPHLDITKQLDDIENGKHNGFGCVFMMQRNEDPDACLQIDGEYVTEYLKINKWFVWMQKPIEA